MKYLSHYIDEGLKDLYKKYDAFTAFSNARFHEMKQDNMQYVKVGSATFVPKDRAEEFIKKLDKHVDDARKQDIAENGVDGVILRELRNHECFFTGDYIPALEACEPYGITEDMVLIVFNDEADKYE